MLIPLHLSNGKHYSNSVAMLQQENLDTIKSKKKTHRNWMNNIKSIYLPRKQYFQSEKKYNFIENHPMNSPTKFDSNWPSSARED